MLRATLNEDKVNDNFLSDVGRAANLYKSRLAHNITLTELRGYNEYELWDNKEVVGALSVTTRAKVCSVYLLPHMRGRGQALHLYEAALRHEGYLRSDVLLTKGSNLVWAALARRHRVTLNVEDHDVDLCGWDKTLHFWWPIVPTDTGPRSLRWLRKRFPQADASFFQVRAY